MEIKWWHYFQKNIIFLLDFNENHYPKIDSLVHYHNGYFVKKNQSSKKRKTCIHYSGNGLENGRIWRSILIYQSCDVKNQILGFAWMKIEAILLGLWTLKWTDETQYWMESISIAIWLVGKIDDASILTNYTTIETIAAIWIFIVHIFFYLFTDTHLTKKTQMSTLSTLYLVVVCW